MIRFAEIEIGRGGLPACRRCASQPRVSPRARDGVLADLEAVCSTWRDGPGPNVVLAGTESFQHSDLPEIVDAATRNGVERLAVQTAGRGLAENSSIAVQSGVRVIEYVAVAVEDRAEQALTGSLGRAEEGLAAVAQFGLTARSLGAPHAIWARLELCSHNVGGAADLVRGVVNAGATNVALALAPSALAEHDWMPLCAEAIDAGIVRAAWVHLADPTLTDDLGPLAGIAPAARFEAS